MKQNLHSVALLFLLIFLISSTNSHSSARKLAAKEGKVDENINNKESVANTGSNDSFDKLMGLEECVDEEYCFKRRAIAEAHLDYIYTQDHKP